jgi:Vitamin K-dependent gamma-carboxylase
MNSKKIFDALFAPTRMTHLAVFRICIAFTAIIQYICLRNDIFDIFGKYGYLQQTIMDNVLPSYQPRLSWIQNWLQISDNQEIMFIENIYYIFLISCFLLLLGFGSRLAGLVCLVLQVFLIGTSHAYCYGFDYFMCASFFYCFIFPVGATLSVDAMLNKNANQQDYFFYTFWLRVHLGCIYFFSGFGKSLGAAWWNGEALWRTLMSFNFKMYDFSFMAQVPWLAQFFCLFTLFIEFFYPIGINFKKTRRFWLWSVVLLHVGIAFFMGLWFFATIMIIWNVAAYGTFPERINIGFSKVYNRLKFSN